MSTEILQVRDVPSEDAQALRARAASRNMSLSSYLRELIHDDASRPAMTERGLVYWTGSALDPPPDAGGAELAGPRRLRCTAPLGSSRSRVRHCRRQGPPDPGFARESRPSRSMCASKTARWGAPRCRRAPRPAPTKRSSCATATPRLRRQRRPDARSRNVNERIAPALCAAARSSTRRRIDRATARARRHAEQGHASARTPSWARRWRSCAPRPTRAACPSTRYLGGVSGARAARAADEHPERRPARRETRRTFRSSWSCRSARRPSPKGCAGAPRSTTRCTPS